MAAAHRVAREAFQAELEELEAQGWFTFEGKDPVAVGRQAARWVASELERTAASLETPPSSFRPP